MFSKEDVEQLFRQYSVPMDRPPDFDEIVPILAQAARRHGVKLPPWFEGILEGIEKRRKGRSRLKLIVGGKNK